MLHALQNALHAPLSELTTACLPLLSFHYYVLTTICLSYHVLTGAPSRTSSAARWCVTTCPTSRRRASSRRPALAAWSRRRVQSSSGAKGTTARSQTSLARGASLRYQRRRGSTCTLLASPRDPNSPSVFSGRRRMPWPVHARPANTEGRRWGLRRAARQLSCCMP